MCFTKRKISAIATLIFISVSNIFAQSWEEQSLNGTPRRVIFTQLVDWDEDRDLDILGLESAEHLYGEEKEWTNRLVWYKNEDSHRFSPEVILNLGPNNPISFEVVDFDHNGKKDILLVAKSLSWFQCQADGSYIQWTLKPDRDISSCKTYDLNGDGHLDVLATFKLNAAYDSYHTVYFLNDGKGHFQEVVLPNSKGSTRALAGDINNDGYIDVITLLGSHGRHFQVFYGKAEMKFNLPVAIPSLANDLIREFRLADYNLDGKLDISYIVFSPRQELIVLDGSQNFNINSDFKASLKFNWSETGYALPVDFDQNGYLDCLYTNHYQSGVIQIRHAENDKVETIDPGFRRDGVMMMTTGDLDGDGDLDIVYAVNPFVQSNFMWLENINGSFSTHMIFGTYEDIHDIRLVDYDLDGDEDILLACTHDDLRLVCRNGVYLWENRGKEGYTEWFIMPLYHERGGIQYLDVDQDGDLDIVGISKTEGTVVIYENNQAPNAWSVKSVASNLTSGKISALSTKQHFDILTWSTNDNKLNIFSKPVNTDLYLQKSLSLPVNNIVEVEILSSNQSGKKQLMVLSRDTFQTLNIFETGNDGSLRSLYTFKGFSSIASYSFIDDKNQKRLVFLAKRSGKVDLFVLLQHGEKYNVKSLHKFEQTDFANYWFSLPRFSNRGNDLYFRDKNNFYKVNLDLSTSNKVVKQHFPEKEKRQILAFTVGKTQDDEPQQIVGSLQDGYISIFRKKP